ncbi:MAG TPA: hypothetical protein VE781_07365 [Kineosporiaceae bacterium]|nr:hypothetical protein [Kineosporiaceae bacterium]
MVGLSWWRRQSDALKAAYISVLGGIVIAVLAFALPHAWGTADAGSGPKTTTDALPSTATAGAPASTTGPSSPVDSSSATDSPDATDDSSSATDASSATNSSSPTDSPDGEATTVAPTSYRVRLIDLACCYENTRVAGGSVFTFLYETGNGFQGQAISHTCSSMTLTAALADNEKSLTAATVDVLQAKGTVGSVRVGHGKPRSVTFNLDSDPFLFRTSVTRSGNGYGYVYFNAVLTCSTSTGQ